MGRWTGRATKVFHNCFVLRFDADGRCREFTEYFTKQPKRLLAKESLA